MPPQSALEREGGAVFPSPGPQPTPRGPAQPGPQSEDAAATGVGPAGKRQRPPARIGRNCDRSLAIGPSRSRGGAWVLQRGSGAAGTRPKPRKLLRGAMDEGSLRPHKILTTSPEDGHRTVTSSSIHRGYFWQLRDRQTRVGLFEICPGHELHRLTRMMQKGLWAATQASMDNPPRGPPTLEDFSQVRTQVHDEGFELGTLAGSTFARLRRSLGLTEEDYQATLGPDGGPYLQFISTSKSSASFFLSHDQRFFLKTQSRHEVQVLLACLPRYVAHLQQHPHSLLARLLGVHSLRVAHRKKKYFIIMQSVFYPVSGISERYDFKGCEVNRWVDPAPEGSCLVLVLKDLNFKGKTMNLGAQRSWFLRQMELDTDFLRELNLLDYSLLMAFQFLHEDEKDQHKGIIFRITRSMQGALNLDQNRRLLPDAPNALHIVDGPEHRYFLGLVDLTTVYGLRKRLEQMWKMLRYPSRSFSTVSPARYASRLYQWVEEHTQ